MNVERLTEIRQRAEAATPGPWNLITMGRDGDGDDEWGWIMGANKNWRWDDGDGPQSRANADFIAHSRDDIPYLLSEVDRLNALHKREIIITGEYAQRVIDLTARAEAAEAERDAAVEDLKRFSACCQCNANIDGSCCDMFDGTAENKYFCSNWQWRGGGEK